MRRALAMSSMTALVVLVSAAAGCGSNEPTFPGDGGLDGAGTAGTGGTGGGGGGSAGMGGGGGMVSCGDPYATIDPTAVIDDMEAPDYMTVRAGGRTGAWWAGGDALSPGAAIVPNGDAAAEQIAGGRCGSKFAMHVTGHGYTMWSVLSVSMGWGSVDGGAEGLLPNNNDFRTGVTFWARIGDTSSDKVRLAISDKYSRPEGHLRRKRPRGRRLLRHPRRRPDEARHGLEAIPHPVRGSHPAELRPAPRAAGSQQHLHDRVPVRDDNAVRLVGRRPVVLLVARRGERLTAKPVEDVRPERVSLRDQRVQEVVAG